MASGSFTVTNLAGVTYALTYTAGTLGSNSFTSGANYSLTITYPSGGGSPITINNIDPNDVLASPGTGGSVTTLSLAGPAAYVVPPGATGATVNIVANVLGTSVVHIAGTATVSAAADVGGSTTIDVDGGTATLASNIVAGALTGTTVNIDNGGTFGNGLGLISALNGATINFGANGGVFVATGGGSFVDLSSTKITGFNNSKDFIDFNVTTPIASYSIVNSNGSQIITMFSAAGTELATATVAGTFFTPATYSASGVGPLTVDNNGTGISIEPLPSVCFLSGTRLATPDGQANVETLKIGDLILTADGRTVPVRWIGMNTVSSVFADPLRFLPIRIRAGALSENVPTRDLMVSPDHAMFINDTLVHASALVNDVSIVREGNMPKTFVYYHVELKDHSLILAEGASTETFVDNVDRMAFDNWAEHQELLGSDSPIAEMKYPRAKSARQLPHAIRQRLAARLLTHFAEDYTIAA